jgi:predicted metallopeptidase
MIAKTIKNSKEARYFSGYEYLIEISGEAWDQIDEADKKILIYHELLHINPVFNEKKEEWNFKLNKHEFADFHAVNNKFGGDYQRRIKTIVSSLYDIDPNEEQNLSF